MRWRNRFGREMKYTHRLRGRHALHRAQVRCEAETDVQRAALRPSYLREMPCAVCNGKRLKPEVLAVLVDGHSIADVAELASSDACAFMEHARADRPRGAASPRRCCARSGLRLEFLLEVGLSYLSLSRAAGTLSGGEAQRIRLATQIGSGPHRRALRARRADDRPAPARQPPAHRHARQAARPRQHADRRRARRGHHPHGRLDRRHRPGRRRATAARSCTPAATSRCSTNTASLTGDYLAGDARSRRRTKRRTIDRRRRSRSSARARTTSRTSRSTSRSACSPRSPA